MPTRTVMATTESQVCAFCHTPHGATAGAAPLWNRAINPSTTYTVYTSSSLDANVIQGQLNQPGGSSKLCLSCHDGTLAIGSVNVLNGAGSQTTPGTVSINMTGTGSGGVIPNGTGANTGFTRNLGIDLTNDHPVSVSYTQALAQRDGELRAVDASQKWPSGSGTIIGVRTSGYRPKLPLEPTGPGGTGQVQCASCHDPHIVETDASKGNQKFLRQNRFQEASATATYSESNDIICLSCHDRNGGSGVWAYSAHANSQVATQTYLAAPAAQREFPSNIPVWKAACLNCHDTHTVPGARRLLREGTDSGATPKSGGNAALEETCYQCHSNDAGTIITPLTTVPNIKSDFSLLRHMPIKSTEQSAGAEVHDIGGNFNDASFVDCTGSTNKCGADFIERRAKLGVGDLNNRHAECTDCHNPHRVLKKKNGIPGALAAAATPDASGTHTHTDTTGYTHTNIISGVLRGNWGVEPIYGSQSFHVLPTGYTVKRGDPGNSSATDVGQPYVTREYQICLKCHSDYGYSDNNKPEALSNRPPLGSYAGATPSGINGITVYTNQAQEAQAPAAHKGEGISVGQTGGAFVGNPPFQSYSVNYNTNNHRGWHPIIGDTGRTLAARASMSAGAFKAPWANAVGTQTMYCSDCHGSNVTSSSSVIPNGGENGNPWGPHGSTNNFLLKGTWSASTGTGNEGNGICFKCHNEDAYTGGSGGGGWSGGWGGGSATFKSGFSGSGGWGSTNNLHIYHAAQIGRMRCTWCHAAVPHGWKNKQLLVNLNDVGPEALCRTEDADNLPAGKKCTVGQPMPAGTQMRNGSAGWGGGTSWANIGYTNPPYYLNAINKIRTFATSGNWDAGNCGSAGAPGNGDSGQSWMRGGSESCDNPP